MRNPDKVDYQESLLRLEFQRALLAIVSEEWKCRRSGSDSPSRTPSGDEGPGDELARYAASLDAAKLAELRLQLATALLHQVDRLQAAGRLVASNEEMA